MSNAPTTTAETRTARMVGKEVFALAPDMATSSNSSFISGFLLAERGDLDKEE
jgi:hypothetical protein